MHRYRYATIALLIASVALPAQAQWAGNGGRDRRGGNGTTYGDAVDAAILGQVSRDRQADKDARQVPHASPGYGPIANAAQARQACADDAVAQAGKGAKISGAPVARTMATGWEVEGAIHYGDGGDVPFVCSVRNGSVSALALQDASR